MIILVKYNQYKKTLENIVTYKELRKQIKKSFKYILKDNFIIYYFDEDNVKITISNQIDLDAIRFIQNFEIIVQEIEDTPQLPDNSFQICDKNVEEYANYFFKLSNDHENNGQNSPKIIQKEEQQVMRKKKDICQIENNEYNIFEKQRQKVIKELNLTINHLRSEILKIENDDTEKRLNEKILKLEKPQFNQSSLVQELRRLSIIQQIEQAENNIINLNKVEREELRKNQNKLVQQIQKIISNRLHKQSAFQNQNIEVIQTEQKLQQQIIKTQKKNQKLIKQYNQLLIQYQKKLKETENQQCNFENVDYMNKDQLEKYLDQQMKQELKAKKQKQIQNEIQKEQLIDQYNEFENYNQIVNFENSFEID